eukprot:4138928-Alexandrium_andersonii.AAC.1
MHVRAPGLALELRKTTHGHLCLHLDDWPGPGHPEPVALPDDGAEIAMRGAHVAKPCQPRS